MDPILITTFLILFLLSAFFSASEIALMSLPNHKIDLLIKQNRFWSRELKYIKEKNDRLLIAILIWNNLVNVYIASLATQLALNIAKTSSLEESLIIWLSTWVITFLLLMFWEIVPKSFATKNAETISLLISKIYKFLLIILLPFLVVIEFIIKITTWKAAVPQITDEEIESFIDMWKDSWVFEASEHEKIKNMLEFSDITVEEIFTPRVKIDAVNIQNTVNECIDFILNHTHSRIPVYIDSIDNIEYLVNLRFLLNEQKNWNWNKKLAELNKLDKVIKIPLNHPIDKLLEIFKNSRKHLAIVLDEYSWVAWLVTLEDIIEEVFGDIKDETDIEKELIKKLSNDKYDVSPDISFEDLLDILDVKFEDIWLNEIEYHATTLNYFITEELERFPYSWEIIEKDIVKFDDESNQEVNKKLIFEIWEVYENKIQDLKVYVK